MSFSQECSEGKVFADQLINEEKFATEFICQICQTHVVGNNPKLTKCSHLFCGDCLADWFTKHQSQNTKKINRSVPCPACASSLRKETDVFLIEKNSALLWRMLQGLKVKCDSKQGPCVGKCCKWTGEYADYGRHLQAAADATAEISESEEVITTSVTLKELPPSPSTCSQCSPAPSEKSSFDDDGKECPSEEDWHPVLMNDNVSALNLEEPLGQDFSALIRGWMDLEPGSSDLEGINAALPPRPLTNRCDNMSQFLQDVLGVEYPRPEIPSEDMTTRKATATQSEMARFVEPSPTKLKTKKEKSFQAHVAQTHAQAQASYQWQLYAQYQAAYAQQYQAAYERQVQVNQINQMAHAARVHQAMQLHQQHLLAQVSHSR